MITLDKITIKEAKKLISDTEGSAKLKEKELIFKIPYNHIKISETNELVDIEIALRQCERAGFFRK